MACLQKLKEDLALLERTFPKTHDRFQVSATLQSHQIDHEIPRLHPLLLTSLS